MILSLISRSLIVFMVSPFGGLNVGTMCVMLL